MPGTLLERIWFSCRHQFSWPRRSEDGEDYQICLECGVRYRYDWHAMRRTDRLEQMPAPTAVAKRSPRKCSGKSAWKPRDRRLRVESPVQYREKGRLGEWCHGRSLNISRSGLLFEAQGYVPPVGAALELVFRMPAEICGTSAADVLCQAKVVRTVEAVNGRPLRLAAAISDYVFLSKAKVG